MTITFERPVGAHADVKELEYVAALHQTCTPLRPDGSIDAQDIVYFLLSRYALETTEDIVKEEILVDLAGDPEEEPKHIMDLRQITALLMIPHLTKVAANGDKNDQVDRVLLEITSDLQENVLEDLVLSKQLLLDMFDGYGEANVPEELIDEMIAVAGGEGATLDSEAFLHALTSDVAKYEPAWENKLSTHYSDVLKGDELVMGRQDSMLRQASGLAMKKKPTKDVDDMEEPKIEGEMSQKVHKVLAFSSIDHVADTYRSQSFTIILWAAFIAVYIAYVYSNDTGTIGIDCDTVDWDFGCKVVNAIGGWFAIFANLCILGGTFIMFGSAGNSIFAPPGFVTTFRLLFGVGVVVCFTILPYFVSWETWFFNTDIFSQQLMFQLFNIVAMILGGMLLLIQLQTLVRLLIPRSLLKQIDFLHVFLTPGMVKKESNTKRAAAFKTNKMVENALELHLNDNQLSTHRSLHSSMFMRGNGLAMSRYQATSHIRESVGGLWWGWRQFLTSRICYEEGVWFHTRLLASSLTQCMLIVLTITLIYLALFEVYQLYAEADENGVVCVFGSCGTINFVDDDDAINGTIDSGLNQIEPIRAAVTAALVANFGNVSELMDSTSQELFYNELDTLVYNRTGINISEVDLGYLNDLIDDPYSVIQDWFLSNVERWEAVFAVCVGGFFCALSVFMIVAIYIPSFISNVLQFRAGMISSLNDSDFELYRRNVDQATSVFGMAFWGQLFTAAFAFAVPGLLGFLLVWSETRDFVTGFVAQLIGIAVTLGAKMLVLVLLRRFLMVVFYRKKIALTNIVFVFLECWNIALSTGFLVVRTCLIFGVAIFYLGRIDTPFLAPGVGQFGKVSLDKSPICYRKDLLVHEAHRHPYIERLGALYLMKLRHGSAFGSRAGSCWRLLYVLALMPWMRKYRGHERTDELANLAPPLEQPMEFASKRNLTKGMGGVSNHELETEVSIQGLSERRKMLREQSERLTAQIESMKKGSKEESHELDA